MRDLKRRHVLYTTGMLAAGTALAGCSEDDSDGEKTPDDSLDNESGQGDGDDTSDDDGSDSDGDGTDGDDGDDGTAQDLAIKHIRFVEDRPLAYRDYTEVPDATYERGEIVWIYFEGSNVTTEDAGDGQVQLDVTLEMDVTNPNGKMHSFTEEVDQPIAESMVEEQFYFWNFNPEAPASTGDYTVELRLTDDVTGDTADAEVTFTVEGSETNPYQDAYRNALTSGIDIDISELRVENRTVYLSFTSPFERGTGDNNYQMGYVAGRYADQIDNGWDVDQLEATMTESLGDRYRFTVTTDLAERWKNEEISTGEFTDTFLATVEQLDDS
jgi:hypothetical protein